MIPLSDTFDLGRDRERMKDIRDASRQRATAERLLERLFDDDAKSRWELQILADEVGMGKTYVALAVAFTLLERLVAGEPPADLGGCYRKVVILTPPNASLLNKWYREVSEFVKRCVHKKHQASVQGWFRPVKCERLDDFVRELRRPGGGPRVIVATMDIFGDKKLRHYDPKRRFLLGALFRYWSNRLQFDRRERLLRGSPAGWPQRLEDVFSLMPSEAKEIPCSEDEAIEAIRRLDRSDDDGHPSPIERLLEECRSISEPYVRDRDVLFSGVEKRLNGLYREMVLSLLRRPVPLVIVDEAHNWKNGPLSGANGYRFFARYLASRTRRALLLTATPFQLRPQEMLELLKIGEELQPRPDRSGTEERRERFLEKRNELETVLNHAGTASGRFTKVWSKLTGVGQAEIETVWHSHDLASARTRIEELVERAGVVSEPELSLLVREATAQLVPAVRSFFGEALSLHAYNLELSHELGPLVVRHRRHTDHRVFRVGCEYGSAEKLAEARFDRHVLHASPGLDVRGEAELPHYLLMRCVSDTKKGKGRSSLGSALTGCYSTLLASAEGKRVRDWLKAEVGATRHFQLLLDLVDQRKDPKHPKVKAVVDEVLRVWKAGEKTLLFCFRTNTAERLHEIIRERISEELHEQRKNCLGGEASLTALRGRITRRDGDLIPLALDRVLWSLAASKGFGDEWPFATRALELQDGDMVDLARTFLRHGMNVDEEKIDRVFITRAVEHVVAGRLLREKPTGLAGTVLKRMAEVAWVEQPYGLQLNVREDDEKGEDAGFQPRGVHTRYPAAFKPPDAEVQALADRIRERRARARGTNETPIFDVDAEGPSLWFGGAPRAIEESSANLVALIHKHLADLTIGDEGTDWESRWASRRQVFEALRRTLLRESILVRLLPSKTDRDVRAWGELLVEAFWKPSMPGQHESMAHRIEVFLEDLRGASGSFDDESSARATLLDATRLRDQRFVALVKGGNQKGRERVFAGFNTPLLPDVLVCTSVGAEGIDLHRHCRHVIHYDLAWNPAVLEQRTGRIDRIGSKTFRERAPSGDRSAAFLEVGVPYLAGTYDERIYEELRLRAQIFEVLTGGEVTADNREGQDDVEQAEGKELGYRLVALPIGMVEDLRVKLQVWEDQGAAVITGVNPGTPLTRNGNP